MLFEARIFKFMRFFFLFSTYWMLPILYEVFFVFGQSILFLWRMSREKKKTGKYVPIYFVRFTVLSLDSPILKFQSPFDSTWWFFSRLIFKPVYMLCFILSFHKGFQLKIVLNFYQKLSSVNLLESRSVFNMLHSRTSSASVSKVKFAWQM